MSVDLLESIGTRDADGRRLTFEWGEPDEHGWYTPTITTHEPGLIEEAIAGVTEAFAEYIWGLSISPQPASGPCQESVEHFRDSLVADLRGLQESR
jgi:hypothetical protein